MGIYSRMKNRANEAYGTAKDYYLKEATMDQLQSSENQAALQQLNTMLKGNLNTSAATAAITGATPAAQALMKKQAMQSVAEGTAGIAKNASAMQRDNMQGYIGATRELANAMNEIDKQKMSFIGGIANAGIAAGAKIASAGLA